MNVVYRQYFFIYFLIFAAVIKPGCEEYSLGPLPLPEAEQTSDAIQNLKLSPRKYWVLGEDCIRASLKCTAWILIRVSSTNASLFPVTSASSLPTVVSYIHWTQTLYRLTTISTWPTTGDLHRHTHTLMLSLFKTKAHTWTHKQAGRIQEVGNVTFAGCLGRCMS